MTCPTVKRLDGAYQAACSVTASSCAR